LATALRPLEVGPVAKSLRFPFPENPLLSCEYRAMKSNALSNCFSLVEASLNRVSHRVSNPARQRRIRSMGAINLARTNRKFAAAKFLVRLQLRD